MGARQSALPHQSVQLACPPEEIAPAANPAAARLDLASGHSYAPAPRCGLKRPQRSQTAPTQSRKHLEMGGSDSEGSRVSSALWSTLSRASRVPTLPGLPTPPLRSTRVSYSA